MTYHAIREVPDSDVIFRDTVFMERNKHISEQWVRIGELYPAGVRGPLLPETLSREQLGQGRHYECFMLSALATLVNFPDIIRNCFVSRSVRRDGRYTFQFFREKEWVKVEIDDCVMLEDGEVLFMRSPTCHWWPLLLEKAYAKFYTGYDNLEGCTLQEAYHDLTGNPVLNIPMDEKLARAAGVDVTGGQYWLDLGQKLQSGQFVGSLLTRDMELEAMGLQGEQQYGMLEVFSLTGTSSVSDIVIHLHNPFEDEEFTYKGPLNGKDMEWTPKLREKYNVEDARSIFLPLHVALKIMNSMQLCYVSLIDGDATYFDDEWKGETAGGNPTSVTWRKNPLYCVRNTGINPVELVVMIKQKDQRRYTVGDERAMYLQCGIVVVQNTSAVQVPTYFVTGNNHKAIHKSLFLNSREVSSFVKIPPNSLCYLVPSCMKKGAESSFTLALYRMRRQDYSSILIRKLSVPNMDWAHCATERVELEPKVKERVDFFVDCTTDIHILMRQEKPHANKSGGDIMTLDYVGVYLYDDTDRKIGGVHAATNFRETSVLHRLPRSGRYAISITCPRASGEVPIVLTIVGSPDANVRMVEPPEDASMFDDEDDIAEGDEDGACNPIDYKPVAAPGPSIVEVPDSTTPFEDKRFMVDNKVMTNEPWIHIGDLYPEGKTRPLLPDQLDREHFEQGEHFECCCLTAFAALVEHHPDVIRDAFVTKAVRRDGRYTFRFHRYGQWVKVEIDDRIPLVDGGTLFCRSRGGYWWPLLLEKAYAKFYTLYQNIEGCTLREVFYDLTGLPVLSIPMELKLANAVLCDVDDVQFWVDLNESLRECACAAAARPDLDDSLGLSNGQEYAVLGIVSLKEGGALSLSDLAVKLHNPLLEAEYTGPMNARDGAWTPELRSRLWPERHDTIYIPVDVFRNAFLSVEKVLVRGLAVPGWQLSSEWGEGTNGGNPTLVTWRENPIYVVRNTADTPLQIVAMIGQPDQRRVLHLLPEQEVNYVQCGLVLSQCTSPNPVPTYLVTSNNHRIAHKGLFVNFRESADIVTIPPKSISYLIPSAMFRDKTKFVLSYWFQRPADARFISICRLEVSVARSVPAIEHLELRDHGKRRVDFLVDMPTDIHILLRQEKPCASAQAYGAMADDFLGMYLYDGDEKRISGVTAATNYREMGLVHRLPSAGRYTLSVTCPRGGGSVPCRVEIVGVEAAKVRITDPPEGAGNLCEVDLRFLDFEPEGVPLEDLPLDGDASVQALLEELKRLHEDFEANVGPIAEYEGMVSARVHKMARQLLAKDRPKYLPGYDLQVVNTILDAEPGFVDLERSRYHLKGDPRNATKVRNVEKGLLTLANEIIERHDDPDLTFLGAEVAGIPVPDLALMGDPVFAELAREHLRLKRDPIANASRLVEVEGSMVARAMVIAEEMHTMERQYLDPEPEGVPLDLLPLNEDEVVSAKEDRLRALRRRERCDEKLLRGLEDEVSERVHSLARELKTSERDMFLDPSPGGFPASQLPLDEDAVFHPLEVERLRLRRDSAGSRAPEIKEAERQLNDRAHELAHAKVEKGREFLDPEPLGFALGDLDLAGDSEFVRLESELWKLRCEPRVVGAAVRSVEEELSRVVRSIALRRASLDRDYLDTVYEGRPVHSLPLNDNREVVAMETKRRMLVNSGADRNNVEALESLICDAVREVARVLNVRERPEYLDACPGGVPVEDLPLDADTVFHELEVQRQRLRWETKGPHPGIEDVERALNDRASALAREQLSGDRGYLDPAPLGVPARLLPLDADRTFHELEVQRALLKRNPQRNGHSIHDLEDSLNGRASALAAELKQVERSKFLDPNPGGIPISDVPIDNDDAFCGFETRRLVLCEDPHANAAAVRSLEDAMNERAMELADKMRCEIRMFLDPAPLGIPLEDLPLNEDDFFVAKEAELHRLKKDSHAEGDSVASLRSTLNEVARRMAAEVIARERAFLFPEPEGRLLEELPLDSDKEFLSLEKELRLLRRDCPSDAQRIAAVEGSVNERAHQLAKAKNCADRRSYMDPRPHGVPLDDIPLDNDEEFSVLEVKRAALMRDASHNESAIRDLERSLNDRARELALLRLRGERVFLRPEPHGIPLHCLPLDDDDTFRRLEVERLALRGSNSRKSAERSVELESFMRKRANDLALSVKRKVRGDVLGLLPNGIPLSVLPLDDDLPFTELETGYVKALADGRDPLKIGDLARAMRKRSEDISRRVRGEARLSLEQHPLSFTLDELPVDGSELFLEKERELLELRRDGGSDPSAITRVVEELNNLVFDIASDLAARERDFLDKEPEGRRISELNLNDDATFLGLERQRRLLMKDPFADAGRIEDLEQMLNDRSHELAKKFNSLDRPNFLPVAVHGVPLLELPLDSDVEFARLEAERTSLCRDPIRNASTISDVEEALKARAGAMASEAVHQDRMFLGDEFEGVPLRHLSLDDDAEFCALEIRRATYKARDCRASERAIKDLEDQLRDRAAELARAAKERLRCLLAPRPLGVPLSSLPLDVDERFHALEENYRDLSCDSANGGKLSEILLQLDERASELAQRLHDEERAVLDQRPEGIPLSALALNEDDMFNALETEARNLKGGGVARGRSVARVAELEGAMNERAAELANLSRSAYCDLAPEGIPLELLGLGRMEDFTRLEDVLRDARRDSVGNCGVISDIECELNGRAHAAARSLLESDRDYLECEPADVVLSALPLDSDDVFRSLEVERAVLKLKDPRRSVRKVRELERKLVERVRELTEEQKEKDLCGLDREPEGIAVSVLRPHDDPSFGELITLMRDLKMDPKRNATAIEELRERLNERLRDLAQAKLRDDRSFLDKCPEGVPLCDLPLGTDPVFHKLEAERARLKEHDAVRNASHIRELEDRLNDRLVELATEQRGCDLSALEQAPYGVPIHVLQLHDDPVFRGMADRARGLRKRGICGPEFAALVDEMNRCARAIAEQQLLQDREYLDPDPLGVPVSLLPLASDAAFHGLEVQRAVLKSQNARRNAAKIADLELRLNERSVELAEAQRKSELEGLDPEPEGIPLSVLEPHNDAEFAKLVCELRSLGDESGSESDGVTLKRLMNDAAHALARRLKEGNRDFLDPEPEGVPLCVLPLDTDEQFAKLECERAVLRARDAFLNARRIRELEGALNDRAAEFAREQLQKDLSGVDRAPHGVPLELLRVHDDSIFSSMVDEIRGLRRDPDASRDTIDAAVTSMNERAREMAAAQFDRNFLDPEPEGVPLCVLPLDTDERFRELEVGRVKLKLADARRNAQKIAALEDELNGRAYELALEQLREDLSGVDASPEGIPLTLLRVTQDPAFVTMMLELRELKRGTDGDVERIHELEDAMNNRAYELADSLLEGDRGYLDCAPLNVPISELPLCSDEVFAVMEVKRAKLKAEDARRNAGKIVDLEVKLNKRAEELAIAQLERDLEGFRGEYEGVGLAHLQPHRDKEFASLVPELRRLKKDGDAEAIERHMCGMERRLRELAKERVDGDLWFLDKEPEGVLLEYLPLEDDKVFGGLRRERNRLKAQDPRANAEQIRELELKMNGRVRELSMVVKAADFDGVDGEPCGVPLSLLDPRCDEGVMMLIASIRRVRYSTETRYSRGTLADLQDELNRRVYELAENVVTGGRMMYLDPRPEGVDITFISLSSDPQFRALELERAIVCLQSCEDDKRVDDLEEMLNLRAHELAMEVLREDMRYLDQAPSGIPLGVLQPYSNLSFVRAVDELRLLRRDLFCNKMRIDFLVKEINNITHDLSLDLLRNGRDYLLPLPEGVSLTQLPLETDVLFHTMEVELAILRSMDSPTNDATIVTLEDKLNGRAHELAREQLTEDLKGLNPLPRGVPLALLAPHSDELFFTGVEELRQIKKTHGSSESALSCVVGRLDARAVDLAEEYLRRDRASYLNPEPLGVPLDLLPLDSDTEFAPLEAERLQLMINGKTDKGKISRLEILLNKCAEKLARGVLSEGRDYLKTNLRGVPLSMLPFDKDRQFHDLELKRLILKKEDPLNDVVLRSLEDKLNDRACALAEEQVAEDLRGVTEKPRGIPLTLLRPHDDSIFKDVVEEVRVLKASAECDVLQLSVLVDAMNTRVDDLAKGVFDACRGRLNPLPGGIPLEVLPIGEDVLFSQLEHELALLLLEDERKYAARIADLEDRLNSRAADVAEEVKRRDLENLKQTACGIPVQLLKLHEDSVFASLANEYRCSYCPRGIGLVRVSIDSLNQRATEIAMELLSTDRSYLDRQPCGVPLSVLQLEEDPEFRTLRVERLKLILSDGGHDTKKITALEEELNRCVKSCARRFLASNREFLDTEREDAPFTELGLDEDPTFHRLEVERLRLMLRDVVGNAYRIRDLEEKMNNRVRELTSELLASDLDGVDFEPEGVALTSLRPHSDALCAALIAERRRLRKELPQNKERSRGVLERLNDRVYELARETVVSIRTQLDQEPEGIPLGLLPLDTDREFHDMEKDFLALGATTQRNEIKAKGLLESLNERARQLAREKVHSDREFLDPQPEGVMLEDLPLGLNSSFRKREVERAKLKLCSDDNADAIAQLEADLNDLAHNIAREAKMRGRAFLNQTSHGIPKELLPLDEDRNFVAMEHRRRRLKRDGVRNTTALKNLEEMMQDRVDDLAFRILHGDRGKYLKFPEGIEETDVCMYNDERLVALELERAKVKLMAPEGWDVRVKELESQINGRLQKLIGERLMRDREFLDREPEGIPLKDVPLDSDVEFKRLEAQRRRVLRESRYRVGDVADLEEAINDRSHTLAACVVLEDLGRLQPEYRSIPTVELLLHSDSTFKDLANKRREVLRSCGNTDEAAAVERDMGSRAQAIADDVISKGRAFLDPQPEGMFLNDIPLDVDEIFLGLENERRKLRKDARSVKRNKEVIADIEANLNDRAHGLAKEEFLKRRSFMDQEFEGIPISELPLDTDLVFKDAEVARYMLLKDPEHTLENLMMLESVMNNRAHEMARDVITKDRRFLDPEPCGVPLVELPLDSDVRFKELAQERLLVRRQNNRMGCSELRVLEEKMNDLVYELATTYLQLNRTFLDAEPEGVPIADIPFGCDPAFIEMEQQLLKLRRDSKAPDTKKENLMEALNLRVHEVARTLLKKERVFLDPEPLGVPLTCLPLNFDSVLNPLERRRRALKKSEQCNMEAIHCAEDDIQNRVNAIALEILEAERAFLDSKPKGVPLRLLPLSSDRYFRDMEGRLRALRENPIGNKGHIEELERNMNARLCELADIFLRRLRIFLDPEPLGVHLGELPLDTDPVFHDIESKYIQVGQSGEGNGYLRRAEEEMNHRVHELAADLLQKERTFLDQYPEGLPLCNLPLNKDKQLREMEKNLRFHRKEPRRNAEVIKNLEYDITQRVHALARRMLSDDRSYLPLELCGVPVYDIPLDSDKEFRDLELKRHNEKNCPTSNITLVRQIEQHLVDRAFVIAKEFIRKDRLFLDQNPAGVPLTRLPLDSDERFHELELRRRQLRKDTRNAKTVAQLEQNLNARALELAEQLLGWQDVEFHAANLTVAATWPRICELYPEGLRELLLPETTVPSDVSSAPCEVGYLAPFIAALSQHPPLIHRLLETKVHPVNGPYSFIFFDPNSNPVRVDIDDRVPVDASGEPKFTRVPHRAWYPLLLEKAYAKFIGGYAKFDQCTPHETLRDLTGRPVLHIPFDDRLADAANTGDFRSVRFWRDIKRTLASGDVITCISGCESVDGLHAQCSYALLAVIETAPESNDPADIVIKLHNCYYDSPAYDGPLCSGDDRWTEGLKRACHYNPEEEDVLYLPLLTFLRNFSSMQRCHINCGDRLTAPGEWTGVSCGGSPKFTTFRNNPIYLVENKSSRPATILAELRHQAPAYRDPDGMNHYHQVGLALLKAINTRMPASPLLTSVTHRFLQKGMMLDAREVCAQMELPPSTTCYLVPYTLGRENYGKFHVSVYPGLAKVTLAPLRGAGLHRSPVKVEMDVVIGNEEGSRCDFIVNAPCDVHLLLRQRILSHSSNLVSKSDVIGEEDLMMAVYNENGLRLAATGGAANSREQSLVFSVPHGGRYCVVVHRLGLFEAPLIQCELLLYTARSATACFVSVPLEARPRGLKGRSVLSVFCPSVVSASLRGICDFSIASGAQKKKSNSLVPIHGAPYTQPGEKNNVSLRSL